MNFRWSNICVLQFLLVLHVNALKLIPAERTIVRTNGTTRTISKYYLLPQDDDDPYDPAGSAPSSHNEDFAEFLREFRAKKAAEQNPKKKVDKYKIYIKRKLKHKIPEKPKDGPNISDTTTEDLKLPVTTEKYKIPIKITKHIKLPVTTTEGIKFHTTSEPFKLPTTTTEASSPTYTTEATTNPVITETEVNTVTTKATAKPVTEDPFQNVDTTTTEPPITVYTTIITTIHHPYEPSTTTEPHYGQTLENTSFQTPKYDEENGDKPKDLIPHIHIFDSNEAQRGNQSGGPKPEKVIKHVETDGFFGDLTKIVSDEDPDLNKTATDTDEPKNNNILNNGNTLGIQPPYVDSMENKTKLDEEFQKLLELLKEPTKHISDFDTTQNWKAYNSQMPIYSDGIVLIDDSLKTPALKIPGNINHYTSEFKDNYVTTPVTSFEPKQGANNVLKQHPLWSVLVTDEKNSSHQHQINTTYVHEHSSIFDAQLHNAEILKNITSSLFNTGYTQLPSADCSEAHNTEYNQSVTTVYPESTNTPKYTDNSQSDFPQSEANTAFTDYTKSGNMDFGQNETNSGNVDNYQSQNQSNPFYTDYTQSAYADLSQAGSNSDFTGYAESANSDYLHTGTNAINIAHTQSENVNHLKDLSPHYGHTYTGNMELSQVGLNPHYTGNIQSASNDLSQTASNSQYADYIQSANTDYLNYAAIQSANSHYSQTQPFLQYADYTHTSDKDVPQTGSNSAYTDHLQSANSNLSQTQSNSNYADYAQVANVDYAQTGSNLDYTGYTQSENTNYSLTGTSSTYLDYTQATSSTFSESHTHPLHKDNTQSGTKGFSHTDTNSDYTGDIQSANMDYTQTGTNSAYSDYAYTETQSNPYYAYYVQSAGANSHKSKPPYFGHRPILHKSNYQTSRKLFKGHTANKIRDRLHKNKWIEYQKYTEDPQINNGPAHVHTQVENGATNNPSLAKINNYIQLAHVCPVCFKILYNELKKKELTEHIDPNDVSMLKLFKKILLYSYGQSQNQRHSSYKTQPGPLQNHLGFSHTQSQNEQQQPIQTLQSNSLQNDPGVINLQYEHEPPVLSKSTTQNSPSSIGLKNQRTQSQKNIHKHHVPVDTAETILEEGGDMASKIQLFNEENLIKVLSAIEIRRKTRRDKYSFQLYAILKLLFDVGKAYASDGNDASWYGQLPLNTRNNILRYLYHLVRLPWLQGIMLQFYKSNNNLDILRNPIWRSHLATWHIPKVLEDINGKFDSNHSDSHENYEEITVDTEDDESTILTVLKSYIHSPEYNSSVSSAEYYQKQNKVLGQIAMYLKRRGYDMNFIQILINKLHGALNRHIKENRS